MRVTYPENWIEQELSEQIILTVNQRTALKELIQGFIISKGRGFSDSELVKKASQYVLSNFQKHVHDSVFIEIVNEIHEEWKDSWTFLETEEVII